MSSSVELSLSLIQQYPFPPNTANNYFELTKLGFADQTTLNLIGLLHHGYCYLQDETSSEILVLIVLDSKLAQPAFPTLYLPYHIKIQIRGKCTVQRRSVPMMTQLLPMLPIAPMINIYYSQEEFLEYLITPTLQNSDFIISTGTYFIDTRWLKHRSNQNSQKILLEIQELMAQVKSPFHQSYIQISIQVLDKKQTNLQLLKGDFLFKRGSSQINVIKHNLHSDFLSKIIKIGQIEDKIYKFDEYLSLKQKISCLGDESTMIIQTAKDIGLPIFIHNLANQIHKNYSQLDCSEIISIAEFRESLVKIIRNRGISVLYSVKWIQEIYKSQGRNDWSLKQILAEIIQLKQKCLQQNLKICSLIILIEEQELQNKTINSVIYQIFELNKPSKIAILQLIAQKYKLASAHDIASTFHDKIGWEKMLNFIKPRAQYLSNLEISQLRKQMRKVIPSEQVQNLIEVSWDDVGGLENVKEEIIQTILLPIKHPEIFDQWIRPRTGLLFYGPPGTGKTLLGKCIAKQCKMSFISVKGPELLNMYVGQSEKNVREVFERAIRTKPCIVFMDELDALIPKRGNSSDSNQVMDRIVAQLFMQIDRASLNQVFIIGATNRPDLLDPSILRPGRFDKQIYLGISQSEEDKLKILKAQTRNITLNPSLNLIELVRKIPLNFTGADFYGLVSKALMIAAQRKIEEYEKFGEQKESKIIVQEVDFQQALKTAKTSVSESELRRYEQLKKIYS